MQMIFQISQTATAPGGEKAVFGLASSAKKQNLKTDE